MHLPLKSDWLMDLPLVKYLWYSCMSNLLVPFQMDALLKNEVHTWVKFISLYQRKLNYSIVGNQSLKLVKFAVLYICLKINQWVITHYIYVLFLLNKRVNGFRQPLSFCNDSRDCNNIEHTQKIFALQKMYHWNVTYVAKPGHLYRKLRYVC